MSMSARELLLLIITLGVALFGITAALARPKIDEWKAVRQAQATLREEMTQDQHLLDTREQWNRKFDELKAYLPQYAMDKRMDAHWLSVMDSLAAKHGVSITKRQVGEELRVGDIYELPIEVRDWSGSLETIVHFLFDLQVQGAMLDVRQLLMKPNEQKVLRGRFVLYCAYTRAAAVAADADPDAVPVPVAVPPESVEAESP